MKKSVLEMDITEILRMQAEHIANQGINGWGNTMSAAADMIEQLRRERDEALARVADLETRLLSVAEIA